MTIVYCRRIIRKLIYTIHYTVYETQADNIHYPILKVRGGEVEGSKMSYFDFSICYRAGKNEPNAKSGRLIWLPLLEISCLKVWGLHAIVKEAWSLINRLISGLFFQLLRHFLKNWLGAMVWKLAGMLLGQSSRNLMERFLIKAPVHEISRFTFFRFQKIKFKPQYLRSGGLNQKSLNQIPRTLPKEHTCQVLDYSSLPVLQGMAPKLKKRSWN